MSRLLLAAALTMGATSDTQPPMVIERQVSEAVLDPTAIKVMTANVLGFESYAHKGKSNVPALFATIKQVQPDLICLQEFNPDRQPDAINRLADAGYNVVFAATVRQGFEGLREGNAIAAKGRITDHQARALPGNSESIPRQVLIADVETSLGVITIANTHLGLGQHERIGQARRIEGMHLGQDIDCGDYNEPFVRRAGHVGFRSIESQALLSPDRTEATSISGIPTYASGDLIDRASTLCGEIDRGSIVILPIDSDHMAPVGVFDLSGCFKNTP